MNVGFLGLGAMGSAMAHNILKHEHALTVWNRTAASADKLVAAGATRAESPKDLAACEVVVAMLADDAAFTASVHGSGLFDALESRTTFVNCATVSVDLARTNAEHFRTKGVPYVAAPVLGRPSAAAEAKLNVLAAGAAADIDRVAPILDAIGMKTWRVGDDAVDANAVKIAANFMIVSAIETMAEAFAIVRGQGVDPRALFDVVSNTLFAAPIYKNYGAQILDENFEPGFKLKLGLKDVRLALQAGEKKNTALPFASALRDVMLDALTAGDGERDWTALARVAERRSAR